MRDETTVGPPTMPVITLTPDEKKRLGRIIFLRPRPARLHRKATILYALSRWEDPGEVARRCRLKPETVARVLEEFRTKGVEATLSTDVRDEVDEHRERVKDIERLGGPSREKFRAMLKRFPAPDRWLDDDDDWDL